MVVGLIVEEISNVNVKCVSHWSAKYRSRSPRQGTCKVTTSRSTMQGLVVVGLIVGKIRKVNVNCVQVTGALNTGQGHQVSVPRKQNLTFHEILWKYEIHILVGGNKKSISKCSHWKILKRIQRVKETTKFSVSIYSGEKKKTISKSGLPNF